MNCVNCSQIKEELNRRLYHYNLAVSEHGIPNNVYGDLGLHEAASVLARACWCDKIGGVLGSRTCEN